MSNSGTLNVQTTGYSVGSLNTSGLLSLAGGVTLTASSLNVDRRLAELHARQRAAACGFLNVSGGTVTPARKAA